jgi:predicted transcriptional regulator of viral defense system
MMDILRLQNIRLAKYHELCELLHMPYSDGAASNLPRGRMRLAELVASSGNVIHIDDAVRALRLPRAEAAKILSRWVKQGWMRRVGSGAYIAVPLESLASEHVLDDPWILVPALFSPGYIGGRTAAEHWDLTEQIFRDIVVLTGRAIRDRTQVRHGAHFTLKHIQKNKMFGTTTVWRHRSKIAVSDIHRTIIDILNDPELGGGIQQVADCLRAYLLRSERDDKKLIEYAQQLGNGAVFKRLGFLAESLPAGNPLSASCMSHLTKGVAKLDPAIVCPRQVTKWHLWVPQSWILREARD